MHSVRSSLKSMSIIALAAAVLLLGACAPAAAEPDYADPENWAYMQQGAEDAAVDVFWVCPTVYFGTEDEHNMSLDDEAAKADFVAAMNMEKAIYDEDARFFAPYYRQAGLNVYEMTPEEREQYLKLAYEDVEEAFDYYVENLNDSRPVILAGFSQGSDMCLRLMKERFKDPELQDQLVACYAIGWGISEEEMKENPHLRFASGSDDTGVIVSFNSEAEDVTDSVIVPEGTKTLAINPLSWETGTEFADRSLNDGACFPDGQGTITSEIPDFTGAYIDSTRGTLKVTDVDEEQYPPQLDIFEDGVYHVYDYQFFYRDLQENVEERREAYIAENAA